jgi:hypothetical protein
MNTSDIASVPMVLIFVLNSWKEMLKAASYNMGGRKRRKITSGFSSMLGRVGMNPMAIPAVISKIGYGTLILSAIADSTTIIARINKTML